MRERVQYLSQDSDAGIELLAEDVDYLVRSVDENLRVQQSANLHIHTEYNNLLLQKLPEIREWIKTEGKNFHRKLRNYLSEHDIDISHGDIKPGQGGGRVVVTAFSFISPSEIPLSLASKVQNEE